VVLCRYRVHPAGASRQTVSSAASRGLIGMLVYRRRHGLPEDLVVWEKAFATVPVAAKNDAGRAYLLVARIFSAAGIDDLAARFAWESMRYGARAGGLLHYLRAVTRGLWRQRACVFPTVRAWLKEPVHQLLRAGGAPDRLQF
jgi:hypothetical protein